MKILISVGPRTDSHKNHPSIFTMKLDLTSTSSYYEPGFEVILRKQLVSSAAGLHGYPGAFLEINRILGSSKNSLQSTQMAKTIVIELG